MGGCYVVSVFLMGQGGDSIPSDFDQWSLNVLPFQNKGRQQMLRLSSLRKYIGRVRKPLISHRHVPEKTRRNFGCVPGHRIRPRGYPDSVTPEQ